ncbi:MAG: hypothetical protein FWH38_08805 [Treponema sp.]|nr:hypothetical protein [Treponema sp.]
MKKLWRAGPAGIPGALAALALLACPVPEGEVAETVKRPVDGLEILRNQTPVELSGNGKPFFEIMEEKSVILSAKLEPENVYAGIFWQSSRSIVDLSRPAGPEVTLFARYGGDTNIIVRAENTFNEAPVYSYVKVTVVPTSYFKWDYRLDGWNGLPALVSTNIGMGRNPDGGSPYVVVPMLARSGNAEIPEDAERGGMALEGPAALVIGSSMSTPTNSVYPEDPLFDESAVLDFTSSPSGRPSLYTGKVRISAEYEILAEPAPRQGLRLQVNNNTGERDNASPVTNWLVAEYTAAFPRAGTLTGVFDTGAARLAPNLDQDKKDRIPWTPKPEAQGPDSPEEIEAKQLASVLSKSFVCLSLPDGKVLIRSIRIESAD